MTVSKYFGTAATSWANLAKCHHVDPCTCPTFHLLDKLNLENTLQHAFDEITHQKMLLDMGQEECRALNLTIGDLKENQAFWRSQGHTAAPEYWDKTPTSDQFPHVKTGPAADILRGERELSTPT